MSVFRLLFIGHGATWVGGSRVVGGARRFFGQYSHGCAAPQPVQVCAYLHLVCLHRPSLKRRQASWPGCKLAPGEATPGGQVVGVDGQPNQARSGFLGQFWATWSSCRQTLQRGIDRALPVNASLYKRGSVMDQLRSLRASASLRNWRSYATQWPATTVA